MILDLNFYLFTNLNQQANQKKDTVGEGDDEGITNYAFIVALKQIDVFFFVLTSSVLIFRSTGTVDCGGARRERAAIGRGGYKQ